MKYFQIPLNVRFLSGRDDDVDGLAYLTQGTGAFAPMLLSLGAFAFDDCTDDGQNRKTLTKDKLNVKVDIIHNIYRIQKQ